MIKRVYIDTSVFGGYFDSEFSEDTIPFFDKLAVEEIEIIASETLELEIYRAPSFIIDFFESLELVGTLSFGLKKCLFNLQKQNPNKLLDNLKKVELTKEV